MFALGDTIVFDTDLAMNFKALLRNDDTIIFSSPDFRKAINDSDDNDFLLVKKKIGSAVTILSVKKVTDTLIKTLLG